MVTEEKNNKIKSNDRHSFTCQASRHNQFNSQFTKCSYNENCTHVTCIICSMYYEAQTTIHWVPYFKEVNRTHRHLKDQLNNTTNTDSISSRNERRSEKFSRNENEILTFRHWLRMNIFCLRPTILPLFFSAFHRFFHRIRTTFG